MDMNWTYSQALMDRVMADMRGEIDEGLREPETRENWRSMLVTLLADSNIQFAQRRAELAAAEHEYASGPPTDEQLAKLHEERARHAAWRRKALTYHRAIQRRLAEANALLLEE